MSHTGSVFSAPNKFTQPLFEVLKRHPKRIVFPDGEDVRILRVAEKMVEMEIGIPILLGDRDKIFALAKENGIGKELIKVINPTGCSDFPLFCDRLAMMLQYGQADACVAGNGTPPAGVFRPLLHLIKPDEAVPHVFSTTVLVSDQLQHMGRDGVIFLSDTKGRSSQSFDQWFGFWDLSAEGASRRCAGA